MKQIKVFTDGGARGNPGPAGIGCVIYDENSTELKSISKYIGETTNNQAEYSALIEALKWIKDNFTSDIEKIICMLDSQLVVEQLKGNYRVKNQDLAVLFLETKKLCENLDINIEFLHIPRNQNKIADKLVNQALDNYLK